jgi:hypothetical protein
MNSRKKGLLLCLAACVLLAGAIPALTQLGGGGNDHRPARRAPLSARAASPAASSHTTSPAATSPQPATPTRTRPTYPDQPENTAGAAQAVATFMPRFLAWSQGRAPASAIKHATEGFVAQARAHPPNVTPAERREHVRVLRIQVLAGHPTVAVIDLAPRDGVPYELDFYLARADGRWQISQPATPGR